MVVFSDLMDGLNNTKNGAIARAQRGTSLHYENKIKQNIVSYGAVFAICELRVWIVRLAMKECAACGGFVAFCLN